MTKIDGRNGLADIVRKRVAALGGATTARSSRTSSPGAGASSSRAEARSSIDSARGLEALVARRLSSIDALDPQAPRLAFRVFLESVLLAEFGEQLINDPGFQRLVEDVHVEMEGDPDLRPAIAAASQRMLASRAGKSSDRSGGFPLRR